MQWRCIVLTWVPMGCESVQGWNMLSDVMNEAWTTEISHPSKLTCQHTAHQRLLLGESVLWCSPLLQRIYTIFPTSSHVYVLYIFSSTSYHLQVLINIFSSICSLDLLLHPFSSSSSPPHPTCSSASLRVCRKPTRRPLSVKSLLMP